MRTILPILIALILISVVVAGPFSLLKYAKPPGRNAPSINDKLVSPPMPPKQPKTWPAPDACPNCLGSGKVYIKKYGYSRAAVCPACGGTGKAK
jgi:hypothetical protein